MDRWYRLPIWFRECSFGMEIAQAIWDKVQHHFMVTGDTGFRIICDDTNNSIEVLKNGSVNIRVEFVNTMPNKGNQFEEIGESLYIFAKYGDPKGLRAEHNVLYSGPDSSEMLEEDIKKLQKLGWEVNSMYGWEKEL